MSEEDKSLTKPLSVKFKYRGGRSFDIPYGFSRIHQLQRDTSIHCILVELSNKNEWPKKIGEDVTINLYDNSESDDKLIGEFQLSTYELYNISNYQYALIKMKKKIED